MDSLWKDKGVFYEGYIFCLYLLSLKDFNINEFFECYSRLGLIWKIYYCRINICLEIKF